MTTARELVDNYLVEKKSFGAFFKAMGQDLKSSRMKVYKTSNEKDVERLTDLDPKMPIKRLQFQFDNEEAYKAVESYLGKKHPGNKRDFRFSGQRDDRVLEVMTPDVVDTGLLRILKKYKALEVVGYDSFYKKKQY